MHYFRLFYLILCTVLLWLGGSYFENQAFAKPVDEWIGLQVEVDPKKLAEAIKDRRDRISFFQSIRSFAEENQLRVWLIGGAAAAYGQFVKWHLAQESGDKRFLDNYFVYDSSHIFRSTQDIDLVVDGDPTSIKKFEDSLTASFPERRFEIRLPRGEINGKFGIYDEGFQNQNTDSYSQGLVEITHPPNNEEVILDSIKINHGNNRLFLTDLSKDQVSFISRESHAQTKRAKEGLNPEIFAVIRILIKALQFGVSIPKYSQEKIKRIVSQFNIDQISSGYPENWLNHNGTKLLMHSLDVDRSLKLLNTLGLIEKLKKVGDSTSKDSVAFWMTKKALPTIPRSENIDPSLTSAEKMGLRQVNHETDTYAVYESLSIHPFGHPNALVSRPGAPGEVAEIGEGFYVTGDQKAYYGTSGLTVVYDVEPWAREGLDFSLDPQHAGDPLRGRLRILNSAILKRKPEEGTKIFELFLKIGSGWIPSEQEGAVTHRWRNDLIHFSPGELEKILNNSEFNSAMDALDLEAQMKTYAFLITLADDRECWNRFFLRKLDASKKFIHESEYRKQFLAILKVYVQHGRYVWIGFLDLLQLSLKEFRTIDSLPQNAHRHIKSALVQFEIRSLSWLRRQLEDEVDLSIIDLLEEKPLSLLMNKLAESGTIRDLKIVLHKSKDFKSSQTAARRLLKLMGEGPFCRWVQSSNLSKSGNDQAYAAYFEKMLNDPGSTEFSRKQLSIFKSNLCYASSVGLLNRLLIKQAKSTSDFKNAVFPFDSRAAYITSLLNVIKETKTDWIKLFSDVSDMRNLLNSLGNHSDLYNYFLGLFLPMSRNIEDFLSLANFDSAEDGKGNQRGEIILKNLSLFAKMKPEWKDWLRLKANAGGKKSSLSIQGLLLKRAKNLQEIGEALEPSQKLPEHQNLIIELSEKFEEKMRSNIRTLDDGINFIGIVAKYSDERLPIRIREIVMEKGQVKSLSDFKRLLKASPIDPAQKSREALSLFIQSNLPLVETFSHSSSDWLSLSAMSVHVKLSEVLHRKAAEMAGTTGELRKSFYPTSWWGSSSLVDPEYRTMLHKLEEEFSEKLKALVEAEESERLAKAPPPPPPLQATPASLGKKCLLYLVDFILR